MQFSASVVLSVLHTSVKKKFVEKLSLSIALKKILTCVKIRLIEMNIMSRDGRQIKTLILFVELCYEKLAADSEICENCFCVLCYASSDEWCNCASPKD